MKCVEVSAAIIMKNGEIFVSQRGYGPYKDGWEFPGGKLETGESGEQAAIREIKEELNAEIAIDKFLCTVNYDYPDFHLTMHCFICHLKESHITLLEHEAARFVSSEELDEIAFLPADILVVKELKEYLKTI